MTEMSMILQKIIENLCLVRKKLIFVQITQDSSIILELKPEFAGAKGLPCGTPGARFSVLSVSDKRMTYVGHMGPYLVRTAGHKVYLEQGDTLGTSNCPIPRDDLNSVFSRPVEDQDPLLVHVPGEIGRQSGARRHRSARHECEVGLFQKAAFNNLVHFPQRLRIFCRNAKSRRIAVNAVAKGGGKAVFVLGVIFAFFDRGRP